MENVCPSMGNLYLATWLTINGSDVWHEWMMQHICDKEGYPHIQNLFKKLETHEKNHNNSVSLLIKTLDDEVESMLKTLLNLKEYESGITNNFYHMKNILYALHNPNTPLKIFEEKELWVNSDRRVAKSDSQTIQKLKTEIERIRLTHKEDFEKPALTIKNNGSHATLSPH
jgi:rubrerythrin